MKIGTLEVENFRRFSGRHGWTLAPVTLLTGDNESGKSTVIDAVEFAISGLTRTTDLTGAGREALVHYGAGRASVTLTSETGDSVTRSIPHGLSMSWLQKKAGPDEAQTELERYMGCNGKDAALTLRGHYWSLEAKTQKSLLFHLLGLRIRSADVQDALAREDEKYPGLPLVEVAQGLLGTISADLEGARRTCYEERTNVNREHKSAKVRAEAERKKAELVPRVEPPDPEALRAAQAEYERAHAAVIERQAARQQRADAEHDLARQRAERDRLEALQAVPLADATALQHAAEALEQEQRAAEDALAESGQQKVQALEAERKKLEQQLDVFQRRQVEPLREAIKTRRAQLASDLAQAEKRAAAIRGTLDHEQCESCLQCVTGPAREAVEAALQTLEEQAQQCRAALAAPDEKADELQALETRLQAGRTMLATKQKEVTAAEAAARDELRALRERHRYALHQKQGEATAARVAASNREQRAEQLSFVLAAVGALEQRLAAMPPPEAEGETDLLQEALQEAKRRLDVLSEQASEARLYEETLDRVRELDAEVEETKARSQALTALVEFFGANGYKLTVLRQKLNPTTAALNRIVAAWGMEVRFDETLELEVRPRGSEAWIAWDLLSDSSQIGVALAHQVLFAQATGLRIVALDRLEAFDAGRQAQLFQACLDLVARDEVDHIILSGVHVLAPVPDAIRHYHLTQEAA